jgi:plastocyanin
MTNRLDSRVLEPTNCFGRAFEEPGTYRYAVVPALGSHFARDVPFAIKVARERAREGATHNVSIAFREGHFDASPAELAIQAGDFVLWCAAGQDVPNYAIVGERNAFANDRLRNQSVYTHVFGSPGTFEWVDVCGSRAAGRVTVTSPDTRDPAALEQWRKTSREPVMVTIKGGKASPADVRILVNQQVFFAVEDGPGITITDKRFATAGNASDGAETGTGNKKKAS